MGRHHENINRVGNGTPNLNDSPRTAYIACRFVGGRVGAWTGGLLADFASAAVGPMPWAGMPNPAYHWAVIVGDYYHQLQAVDADGAHWNWYENERESWMDKWEKFEVGTTYFNDAALWEAGVHAINHMPEKYEVIHNNCQFFVLSMLDLICRDGRKKVFTSWGGWKAQAGFIPGTLDPEQPDEKKEVEVAFVNDGKAQFEMLERAEEIMAQNTPTVTLDDIKAGRAEEPPAGKTVEVEA